MNEIKKPYNAFVSGLLDEMYLRLETADTPFKKQIIKRFIVMLEEYLP